MYRVVGKAAAVHPHGIVLEDGNAPIALKPGAKIVFSVDETGGGRRHGDHDVGEHRLDSGYIFTWTSVRDTTPAACVGDFILTPDPAEPWSPYA